MQLYRLGPEKRNEYGNLGRIWANSDEAGFTSYTMGEKIISGIDEVLEHFSPDVKTENKNLSKINNNII